MNISGVTYYDIHGKRMLLFYVYSEILFERGRQLELVEPQVLPLKACIVY